MKIGKKVEKLMEEIESSLKNLIVVRGKPDKSFEGKSIPFEVSCYERLLLKEGKLVLITSTDLEGDLWSADFYEVLEQIKHL